MSDEDFRMAFKGSPMKRAKLRGLEAQRIGHIGERRFRERRTAAHRGTR